MLNDFGWNCMMLLTDCRFRFWFEMKIRVLIVIFSAVISIMPGLASPAGHTGLDSAAEFGVLLQKASAGDAEAMYRVGDAYYFGKGTQKDMHAAVKWMKNAADKGHPKAMAVYGAYISHGYVSGEPKDAVKWFEKAAKKDYDFALYNLGFCYRNAYGVERDYKKSYEYFLRAAKLGNAAAMNSVGLAYHNGEGVEPDYGMAFNYFLQSAENDNPAAFLNVARCYALGEGVDEDSVASLMWYERAADENHYYSQFLCGSIYYSGTSRMFTGLVGGIDYGKAVKYLKMVLDNPRATDDVKGETCRMLAACYRFGRGVEADEQEAGRLTALAAEYGDIDAQKVIEWYNSLK